MKVCGQSRSNDFNRCSSDRSWSGAGLDIGADMSAGFGLDVVFKFGDAGPVVLMFWFVFNARDSLLSTTSLLSGNRIRAAGLATITFILAAVCERWPTNWMRILSIVSLYGNNLWMGMKENTKVHKISKIHWKLIKKICLAFSFELCAATERFCDRIKSILKPMQPMQPI